MAVLFLCPQCVIKKIIYRYLLKQRKGQQSYFALLVYVEDKFELLTTTAVTTLVTFLFYLQIPQKVFPVLGVKNKISADI